MLYLVCNFLAQNAWIKRLKLSFPREYTCFSLLAAELSKNQTLLALSFADMQLQEEDVAAIASALISQKTHCQIERLEFIGCHFGPRSLQAFRQLTQQHGQFRDLVVQSATTFDLSSVRTFIKDVVIPRISV